MVTPLLSRRTLISLSALGTVKLSTLTGAAQTSADCIPLTTELGCLNVAPDSERVDLTPPKFSKPTAVTNPLFPIANLASVVFLGHVDEKPFRTETHLLPETRVIAWNGMEVECLVSQYLAYSDGRITEIALDWYAQADDGSVWYFGEDVADYVDGAVDTTEGTWLAGRDGPAAMIMPANPKVGDVYRTETIPGIAFEQVTVKEIDLTFHGPSGPVGGGIIATELHQEGTTEDKLFAPGYGEFRTGGGGDLEALALAVPADALDEPLPDSLQTLATGAADLTDAAQTDDWKTAAAKLDAITAAWDDYRAGQVPEMIAAELSAAMFELAGAVDTQAAAEASQAAINVRQGSLDLQLRYLPPADVNRVRLDLWAQQVQVDAAAEEEGAVLGDAVTLGLIRDRITDPLDAGMLKSVNATLAELHKAAGNGDLEKAADLATQLRTTLAG
jgi:hypothetical protein